MRQAVSRTAALVALYRAMESSRPASTRLFEDPLAPAFLGWRVRCALRLSRLPMVGAAVPWSLIDGHWSGPRGTVAVRTRYIDDVLGRALRRGVNQVVILGAGFDSRAYRIPGIEQARVFEVDHPATQAKKKDVVTRRFGTLPPHVTLAPIDFMVSTLDMVMLDSGYRHEALTFFICEGLTHYLSAPAVDAMFRYVARAAAGSQMVFTYIHRGILDGSATFSGADTTLTTVRRAGEPYTFGFDPVDLPTYLTARKLILVEDMGARTYRERYLIPRGRGQEPLAEFQRAALVEVAGHPPWTGRPICGSPHRHYLQTVGIRTQLRPLERAAFIQQNSQKKLKNIIQTASGAFGNAATRLDAFVAPGGTFTYGTYPDIEGLIGEQASEMDAKKREVILYRIQQLIHEKAMITPIWELAFINGHGPRVAESGLTLITSHAYSSPYEDLKLTVK